MNNKAITKLIFAAVLCLPSGLRADEEYVSSASLSEEQQEAQQPAATHVKVGFAGTVTRGAQTVAPAAKQATEEDVCRAKLADIEKKKRVAEYNENFSENMKANQAVLLASWEALIEKRLESKKYSQGALGERVKNSLATVTMTVGELDCRIEEAKKQVQIEEEKTRKLQLWLTFVGTTAGVVALELLGVYLFGGKGQKAPASAPASEKKTP